MAFDTDDLTALDNVILSSGGGLGNIWLEWLIASVKDAGMEDCVACTTARPILTTSPLLMPQGEPGTKCIEKMLREERPGNCTLLLDLFPPGKNDTQPPAFEPVKDSYYCYTNSGTTPVGKLPETWCTQTQNVALWAKHANNFRFARADLFLLCGKRLYTRLPISWNGNCAVVRLRLPIYMSGTKTNLSLTNSIHSRRRRGASDQWDLAQDSNTYIDAIGVPRGVPNRYKLADQIAAGFESMPLISALFPVTPIKNVDRINYIHYNVQKLSNLTRDAVEGLAEQLAATSLMAVQNRMALDMLLAEKGGVCSIFGEACCTFVPNNTAPDGSVTRALAGLRTLSKQMAEDSGIENPLEAWMTGLFGKWKNLIMSLMVSLAVFMGLLVTCGCCIIPCARTLCSRLIETALRKETENNPTLQMPLLENDQEDCDSFIAADQDDYDQMEKAGVGIELV